MPWLECSQRVIQFEQAREFLRGCKRWRKFPVTYQGFAKAQRRDGVELRRHIERHVQAQFPQLAGKRWRWKSFVPLAVDGSRLEAPRTQDNERVLGCAGREKTTPQVMLAALYHLGTSLPYASRVGPGVASERALLQDMLDDFPQNTLLLADAGFVSAQLLHELSQRDHAFLLRIGGNKTLLTDLLPELEFDANQQVWLWPQALQKTRAPLSLRLIEIETANADQPSVFLLTNVAADRMSDVEAGELYRQRWGVEVFFRTAKQTLESRKLKSRAPDLVLAEAGWLPLSVFLLGALTIHAQPKRGRNRMSCGDWSAAKTRRVVCHRIRHHARRGGRWTKSITTELRACRRDAYQRRRPKSVRRHPQKKKERPPNPPILRSATPSEQQRAQSLKKKPSQT